MSLECLAPTAGFSRCVTLSEVSVSFPCVVRAWTYKMEVKSTALQNHRDEQAMYSSSSPERNKQRMLQMVVTTVVIVLKDVDLS